MGWRSLAFFRSQISSFVGGIFILAGVVLLGWALLNLPSQDESTAAVTGSAAISETGAWGTRTEATDAVGSATGEAGNIEAANGDGNTDGNGGVGRNGAASGNTPVLTLDLGNSLPTALVSAVESLAAESTVVEIMGESATGVEAGQGASEGARDAGHNEGSSATHSLSWDASGGVPIYRQFFAAATRFDTIDTELTWDELIDSWRGEESRFERVVVLSDTLPALTGLLGEPGATVVGVAEREDLLAAAWESVPTLTLVPFDQLHPRLVVLAIDGANPVENAARFDASSYPLVAMVYIEDHADDGRLTREQADLLQLLPGSNRDPEKLTVVAATGVTAMTRLTAAEMEQRGYGWPAEVVGEELAAADITLINNEVPFIEGCEPNTDSNNLVFCSKPEYMETLLDSGVTIVGLTGNHQNDFGWAGMAESLEIYDAYGIPVYGGGLDRASAIAPLYLEHNGNRLAFLGVNSFGPPSAWATETSPGSAPYDLAILSATIREIKEQDLAQVVFAEFQYAERYEVEPFWEQLGDFRAVVRAGADIVTGVQSHVPQAIEFLNPELPAEPGYSEDRLILYGLGNLYFDQMWREDTRDNLIAKHTIYDGRHISTQLLTTVLHDYGQPRWAEPERRAQILSRVFGASMWD